MHLAKDVESETSLLDRSPSAWRHEKRSYSTVTMEEVEESNDFPAPPWIRARTSTDGKRFPQAIAHRGYKAEYPENTMAAFKGAVKVGAHALETDIHLTKDGVVVLSHDADLKRCFGIKKKIIDCDWEEISQLRTLRAPHVPMPRLRDLLEYVAQPGLEHIWVLLDIKLDNDANDVMELISSTIASVESVQRAWIDRIVLGIWAARFLPLCTYHLPGFPITHIAFSTCYARKFLKVPNVSFNMFQKVLFGPIGANFIRDVKAANRELFVWTVNEANLMKWSIQKEVDGVITDDPKKFNEICDNWDDNEPLIHPTWTQWIYTFWLYMLIGSFFILFRRRFPETVEQFVNRRQLKAQYTLRLSK